MWIFQFSRWLLLNWNEFIRWILEFTTHCVANSVGRDGELSASSTGFDTMSRFMSRFIFITFLYSSCRNSMIMPFTIYLGCSMIILFIMDNMTMIMSMSLLFPFFINISKIMRSTWFFIIIN